MLAEQVEVKDNTAISTDPDKNLSAITLTEKDLESLPDDPDELLETLKQMAGAAGNAASRVEAFIYSKGAYANGGYPDIDELFRSSHEPGTPEVVVEGDKVTVRYAIHRLLGRLAAAYADPGFVLGRAEAGHPVWGPVYRKVVPD